MLDWNGVAGDADVADLLSRGVRHGIVGITIDSSVIPEGVHGTVRLDEYADQASFETRHHPRVESMLVAELDVGTAELLARSLAGLRPATVETGAGDSGDLRLLGLLGLDELDPRAVQQRWSAHSPVTTATVGLASGSPMTIDLTWNGPHGLIGGTTRSGKTEFLKTLFASLCLSNTPDDLSILIVDFKGGVDHGQSAELAHVVALTTNEDSDTFTRTIGMLVAEQNRRQAEFRAVGAANLDSYNAVRASRPELPPIPRLLVVVDEFAELLSTELGKQHMRTLESVTRIGGGLGLHLLLVTQTFENQLPAEVAANTGLRVCFRVQSPSDSKLVLESPAAANIPSSRPGRVVRALPTGRSRRVSERARVVGRRHDAAGAAGAVRITEIPLGAARRRRWCRAIRGRAGERIRVRRHHRRSERGGEGEWVAEARDSLARRSAPSRSSRHGVASAGRCCRAAGLDGHSRAPIAREMWIGSDRRTRGVHRWAPKRCC